MALSHALCFILGLLCLSFPSLGYSQTCDNAGYDAQLRNEIIPKLQLLQQILDKNFTSPPKAPTLTVAFNATENSVTISVSNLGSFSQAFQVSYYAEVSGNLQPSVVTAIVPAIQGGDFVFRGALLLSASSNFVPGTRYFFSAIARVLSLNQQSNPSPVFQFDYLPSFMVDAFTTIIKADSTPLFLDVFTRYFPQNATVALVMPESGASVNLTLTKAPDTASGRASNVFVARLSIPELTISGSYSLIFVDVSNKVTITRPLQVLPPFRPVFKAIFPSSVPLAGSTARILLTNVTDPLIASSTKFAFQSSPSLYFCASDSVEPSSSGPSDFFVTFLLPNVSSAGTISFIVVPNNQIKATLSFSVVYTAVRLIGSLPTSYFFPRKGLIRVTVAVDTGTPILTSVAFSGAANAAYVSNSSRIVVAGVHEYTLQLAENLVVGSYQGSLTIFVGSQNHSIIFPINVVSTPVQIISFDPAIIFDDASAASAVSVTAQNIGDITSSADLKVYCVPAISVCDCSIASFSLSFASIRCIFRGSPGQFSLIVNNTNIFGYGTAVSGLMTISAATAPRILAVSTDFVPQLGRVPVLIALANFAEVSYLKVGGITYSVSSNFFFALPVTRPFNSERESLLRQTVRQLFPQEPIFSDGLSTILNRLQSSTSYNSTIVLFRMPKVMNSTISVEVGQMFPSANVSVNLLGVDFASTSLISTSVSRISIQGGTNVIVSLKQFIPITQSQDIDIICLIRSGSSAKNVSVGAALLRATINEASFQFLSPVLNSSTDVNCAVVSTIDSILGVSSTSLSFVLSVFDPRSLTLVDASQRTFYTSGGPRTISFNLQFLKVVPVSVKANFLDCEVTSSPLSLDVALNADAIQLVRAILPDFASNAVGDISINIISGSEQVALTVSLIATPSTPTLLSIQGNIAIPSKSNSALVTVTFQQFIASTNSSSFLVFVPTISNFSVPSVNVFSNFQRTVVSFFAPPLINMGTNESTRVVDAFIADSSSSCGKILACVGRFTLQYSNVDLASFVTMNPTSGLPSIPTLVNIFFTNVMTSNLSSITATVSESQKNNVLTQVIGASFGGQGLSSQTFITIRISWMKNLPTTSISLALSVAFGSQTVAIPTAFTVLPYNQPQLSSLSPSMLSIYGGSHIAVFIQPLSFDFRSVSVAIDGVSVVSNASSTGAVIYFDSARVSSPRTSVIIFSFVGASSNATLSSQLLFTAPSAVVVKSVFPSLISSFGSSSQIQLENVPSFWTFTSIVVNLVQSTSSTPCAVISLSRTSFDVVVSILCPSSQPGFGTLELFDASDTSQVARSLSLNIVSPTALQLVSVNPSQYFLSKSFQMTIVVKNFPIGGSPKVSFPRQASLSDLPASILSSYFEPSNSSTTVVTFLVNSPISVTSFAVTVSATAGNGATVTCTTPFFVVIDDSRAAVLSVKPSSIQSIGGSVEVVILGFPSSLASSGIIASFSDMGTLKFADVSSCSYDADGRAIVTVLFSAFEKASTDVLSVSLNPQNVESKAVTFQIQVLKVFPIISSVTPSVFTDIGGDRLLVRLSFFPVLTSLNFVSVSIGGFLSSPFTAVLISSSPDVTTIQLKTPYLNISASGTYQLLVNHIIAPQLSLSATVFIQLTDKVSLVSPLTPYRIFANSSLIIPITLAFPVFDFNKFNDYSIGKSFNSNSIVASTGESICFSIYLKGVSSECSEYGCFVQESSLTNYIILSKNVPYQGCISFGVRFSAKAVAGKQDLQVQWIPSCGSQNTSRIVSLVSVVVETTSMTLLPSIGAVSGGYSVTIFVRGVTTNLTAAVFFGSTLAIVRSQSVLGASLALSVICPPSVNASSIDASIRSGSTVLASAAFSYVLGCLDYNSFCRGLQGDFIANILSLASDPPSASECLKSYCISISSIPAPVLVSFPSKQSTTVSTITFAIKNLFATSGSQIRVVIGSILLPVLLFSYSASSDSFTVSVQSPAIASSSVNTITVYSDATGSNLNASFVLTSLVPITGPIKVVALLPTIINFESTTSFRLLLANFPYNSSTASVTFTVLARYQNISQITTVQTSDVNDFGNASIVIPLRPSSLVNYNVNTSGGLLVNLTIEAVGYSIPNSVSFQMAVRQRVNRQITSISSGNLKSAFRSVVGSILSISVQGFDGPDVTICFGFKSSSPMRRYMSCTNEDQNCVVFPGAISFGDSVSTISMNYTREYFSYLSSSSTAASLIVRISDFARLDACSEQLLANNSDFRLRTLECDVSPNPECLTMIPPNSPALLSISPSPVSYITIGSGGIITGTRVFLTFSYLLVSTDSVSARIGSYAGPDAFATIQDGCTIASCQISIIFGGNPGDASLVGSSVVIILFVNKLNSFNVTIPKIVAPASTVSPSLISASGGSTITVTSYAFSLLNAATQYTVSNSAFSIVDVTKSGKFATYFQLRLKSPMTVGYLSLSILPSPSESLSDTFVVELFPAMSLNNPLVSGCFAGDRQIQVSVSNLPVPLSSLERLSVSFNNVPRPAVIQSSASLNFSFACDEDLTSQVLLNVSVSFYGSTRQSLLLITVPPLPLIMSLVVGNTNFALSLGSQVSALASTLCPTNAAASSNNRCRTASVNTQLNAGTSALNIFSTGSSTSLQPLSFFLISSRPGISLFSFIFDPSADVTPPGQYNLVLSSQSRTASVTISVFDPVPSAICINAANGDGSISNTCGINAVVGGVVSFRLANFAPGLVNPGDLGFSFSKIDGTPVSSLQPQLVFFSGINLPISLKVNKYTVNADFSNGQLALSLNIFLVSSPSTRVSLPIILRLNPQVLSVDFSESLVSLILSFNQLVIPKVQPTTCNSLFPNSTIIKFGTNPVCRFSSGSSLVVEFGSDESIVTGDALSILPDSIIPADQFPISNVAMFPVVAAVPLTFKKASVEIKGTQYVEGCAQANPATLRAIANSPRPFKTVTWSCPLCSADASSLTEFLALGQKLTISIPAVNIRNANCRADAPCGVVITVVDFIGRVSVSAPFFLFANPSPVPDLQFLPLDQDRYTPDMTVMLRTRLKFSACSGDTSSFPIFSWNISPSPIANVTFVSSPRLLLPSNSLSPGAYLVTVTVTLDGAIATAATPLRIAQRGIFAAVSAPNFVSLSSNIVLDARGSMDLETSILPKPTLLFSWTCIYQNLPCISSSGTPLILPQKSSTNSTITVEGSALSLSIAVNGTAKILFKVDVSNSADQRVGSSVAEVNVVLDVIPTIVVAASSNVVNAGSSLPVGLSALVTPNQPNLAVVWSEVSGLLVGGIDSVLDQAFSSRSSTIAINPKQLVPGMPYIFQAVVENYPRAVATVSVSVNSAPSSGKCYVASVQTGAAVTSACRIADKCSVLSLVTVSCENWMDDNLPLAYQIGYRSSSGSEVRFDYIRESSSSFRLPIGSQNLFVDICDNRFACSTFSSFLENPIIINSVVLDDSQQRSLISEVSKSAQSGDVDSFSSALGVAISYFVPQPASGRRLLVADTFVSDSAKQILAFALKLGGNIDIGTANTLIQPASNLAQVSRTLNLVSSASLLSCLTILGVSFSSPNSQISDSQIKTASASSADILSIVSNLDALKSSRILQDIKLAESFVASSLLQSAIPGMIKDVVSSDSGYAIRATSVVSASNVLTSASAPIVSIRAPTPKTASPFEFLFPELNVVDGSSVSIRSSFVPKSKYAATVSQGGNVLLSDVVDCTVVKGTNSQPIKSGGDLGKYVAIRVSFPLTDSGVGSAAALAADPFSINISFYDDAVSPPVWKNDGCTGKAVVSSDSKTAFIEAKCTHLTTFGIIAGPPGAAPTPSPPISPGVPVVAPSPLENPAEFPLWAIIIIPVIGGVSLFSVGGFFVYKRNHSVQVRAKQIVAASAWKTYRNSTTISKPLSAAASSDNLQHSELVHPRLEKHQNHAGFQTLKSIEHQVSSLASSSSFSTVQSRRQQLAEFAASPAENAAKQQSRLSALSSPKSMQQRVHAVSDSYSITPISLAELPHNTSNASNEAQSHASLASFRRQKLADSVLHHAMNYPDCQGSPTQSPIRIFSSQVALHQSRHSSNISSSTSIRRDVAVRARSVPRQQFEVSSPFFVERTPGQGSTNSNQLAGYRARSPLPRSKSGASSPTSQDMLGIESTSLRMGSGSASKFQRLPSLSVPRASSSQKNHELVSSSAPRPGFRKPRSPEDRISRYDQA